MNTDSQIYTYLDDNDIKYISHTHEPVFTMEDTENITSHLEGFAAKTLLVFGEKTKNFYLISIDGHERINKTRIKELLGERIRFSNKEDLERILAVKPGSVSPLGLIFDKDREIKKFVIDKRALDADIVMWHPNSNNQTIQFKKEEFIKFIDLLEHKYLIY